MGGDDVSEVSASHVLTVTLNPALDMSMSLDRLVPDRKLRAASARREPGGGGVNVSRVLHRLGAPTNAFVVVGGPVGEELVGLLRADGVPVADFRIAGNTRESLAISETSTDSQYRISLPGPEIPDPDRVREAIRTAAVDASIVVFSGSLPPGTPPEFFGSLVEELAGDTITIVDTSGPGLESVARRCPAIIKPSQRELARLVGWDPSTPEQIEQAVAEVIGWGAVRAVVASRGPSGVLLMSSDGEPRWFRPPPVHPVSTVGAGDSMVAGIAASLLTRRQLADAVVFGVAAGTAAVLTPGSELCDPADVDRLVGRVTSD